MELLRDSCHKTMLLGTTKKHEAAAYCVPLAFSVTKLVRVASLDQDLKFWRSYCCLAKY